MSNPQPGQSTGRTVTPRQFLKSTDNLQYMQGKLIMDSTYSYDGAYTSYEHEIRPGTLMARITATGKWCPCKRTTVATAGASGSASAQGSSASVPVVDARAFKASDTVTIGTDSATISSINYTTNVLTLSGAISYEPGDAVYARGDLAGAEICRGILYDYVDLKDEDGNARDMEIGGILIQAYVDEDQLLGDIAAVLAATHYLNHIMFDNLQQGS